MWWDWPVFVTDTVLLWICVNRGKNRSWRTRFKTWDDCVVCSRWTDRLGINWLDRLRHVSRYCETWGSRRQHRSLSSVNRSCSSYWAVSCSSDIYRRVSPDGGDLCWHIITDYGCPYWTCFYSVRTRSDVVGLRLGHNSVWLVDSSCWLVGHSSVDS